MDHNYLNLANHMFIFFYTDPFQNKSLSQDARWVKAYRDEIDALKSKVSWCFERFNFLSCNQVHILRYIGEQGWHIDKSTCFTTQWPRFISHIQCHLWLQFFVVVSCTLAWVLSCSSSVFWCEKLSFQNSIATGNQQMQNFLWRSHSEIISIFCIMLDPFTVCYYFRLLFKQSSCLPLQTDKVDRLEADNQRFKEKLRDLDYYKKRAEVNSVIYMVELCSIGHCKENYVNVHNFTHITWMKVR